MCMKSAWKLVLIVPILAIFLLTSLNFVPATFATIAPESGWVHYYTTSGGVCTNTVWPQVATDGSIGYPNNVGGPQPTAVVDLTQTICIKIELNYVPYTSSGSVLYAAVQQESSVSSATANSTNGVDFTIIWTNTDNQAQSCGTVPIFVGTSSSDPSSGPYKEDVGHLIYGPCGTSTTSTITSTTTSTITSTTTSTTPPSGVPQFPAMGSLGLVLIAAMAIPILLGLRKWNVPTALK